MSIEKHIDNMIRAAIERGEFDNLEGAGKPIDLDAYFATPEDLRMGFSVLKSNQIVPEEIERLREIAELKAKISETTDKTQVAGLNKLLNDKMLALALVLERNKLRK
jgi:hypothetical protein